MTDVFGEAFKAQYARKKTVAIDVKINGEPQDPLDPAYFFRSYERMPKLERKALNLCGKKVLDIGAAAGCHSIWLEAHKHEVTCIEQSPGACEVLRARGLKTVHCADFFQWKSDEKFDTILLLMNGLGMGQDVQGTLNLLEKAKSHLKLGGKIIGDSSDIAYFYDEDDESGNLPDEKQREGSTSLSSDQYYGLVHFELKWENLQTAFNWIYPDPHLLRELAFKADLHMEVLAEGPHHDFLLGFSDQIR